MLTGKRAYKIHLHVVVQNPDAVSAQPGERVGGALRTASARRRPELRDEVSKLRLGRGPRQLAGASRGQAAQRKQNQQRLMRRALTITLMLAQRRQTIQYLPARTT